MKDASGKTSNRYEVATGKTINISVAIGYRIDFPTSFEDDGFWAKVETKAQDHSATVENITELTYLKSLLRFQRANVQNPKEIISLGFIVNCNLIR